MQRHATVCLCIVVATLALAGCHRSSTLRFHRLEQLLFETPSDRLGDELVKHRAEYDTPLINLAPGNAEFNHMLADFLSDTLIRRIYRSTDSLYHDLDDVESQLGSALEHVYKQCPSMPHIQRVYTMVTADYENYDMRTFSDGNDMCIAIDVYALGANGLYQAFGIPMHVVRTCTREQIAPDCIRTLAKMNIAWPDHGQTLLDYALAEGKVIYFVEQAMPRLADSTLLRYTGEQMEWMRENEKNVWGWLIQNKMLYSTDISLFQNMLTDAPHTNAFGAGSAPRTAAYIGWQIVRSYMRKSGASMEEMLNETDSQKILTASGWRPKK